MFLKQKLYYTWNWKHKYNVMFITSSAMEVMFLSLFVCLFVCLSVCLLATLRKNLRT